MRALSIRQPWAWAILAGHKPIENRTWNRAPRGRIWIHASKTFDQDGYEWIQENFPELDMPRSWGFPLGGLVGKATLTDVVALHNSPWFCGPFGFILEDPEPCDLIPYKGALGFFNVNIGDDT